MAIPITYNLRSLRARWVSATVAVLGIAGTVGVFVAMLALANGFRATLVSSGSSQNVIVRRAGATGEMESVLTLDSARIIQDAPGVERGVTGPLVSPEVVVIATFPLKQSGTPANAQVRGVSPNVMGVRNNVRIVSGRFFQSGLNELIVGRNVAASYSGFELGQTVRFGGGIWTVVGVFDAAGSAFDSEVWCDSHVLNQVYLRPPNIYQSVTARLASPQTFQQFKDALTTDPRLTVAAFREPEFYERQSETLQTVIRTIGFSIAALMALGAIFGAINTMYNAVASRGREIATLRALGFGATPVVVSVLVEAGLLALAGGVIGGALAWAAFDGFQTSTMNFQSFSQVAFAFAVTPRLVLRGLVYALEIGLIGGLLPAIRAARLPIVTALREF